MFWGNWPGEIRLEGEEQASCSCWKRLVFLEVEESQVGPGLGWRERGAGRVGRARGGRERGLVDVMVGHTHAVADTDPCEPGKCVNQRKQNPCQSSGENRAMGSATEALSLQRAAGQMGAGGMSRHPSPQALADHWLLGDEWALRVQGASSGAAVPVGPDYGCKDDDRDHDQGAGLSMGVQLRNSLVRWDSGDLLTSQRWTVRLNAFKELAQIIQ